MRSIKTIGLAIVAVVAFSAISVSSAAAFTEFVYSTTGELTGKAKTNQEFKTGTGATVVCTGATPNGKITKLNFVEQEYSFAYSGCSVSGIGSASVTLAEYTFFIPGLVSILKIPITISASVFGVKCKIEVASGQMLGSATEIEYENNTTSTIVVKSKVTKIASEIKESNSTSLCGTAGEKSTSGTLTGNVEISLPGGTIQVK